MSCEKNRGAFVSHVAGGGSAAAQAFGGPDEAGSAIETIFDTARAQAASGSAPQQKLAEAKTRMLFDWMKRDGFKPPTHSTTGLPKADAQFGYAAMYDTLAALRDGKALPMLASQIVETFGQNRALSAIRVDEALARMRCGSCGRFAPSEASGKPPHFCPNTATPETFQRALMRRLGVPASAYDTNNLSRLLDEAHHAGVQMRHPITNEPILASLDSLPLAITQGYVPDAWRGEASLALVEVSHGRIAPVLNAAGLTMVKPGPGAVESAAVASGTTLPVGTLMVSPLGKTEELHTIIDPTDNVPTLSGGSAYSATRFVGTEFRKGKGTAIVAGDTFYTVGDRSEDINDWARARVDRIAPEPPTRRPFNGIAVGRTLVAATEYLRTGSVTERSDGVIEVYDKEGGLVSIYDPVKHTAGDVDGSTNASAAQMAAVITYRQLHPTGPLDVCLAKDIDGLKHGAVTPLAASDGAYLAIKAGLEAGDSLALGGALSASKCPECGKFMGAAGCRGAHTPTPTALHYTKDAIAILDDIEAEVLAGIANEETMAAANKLFDDLESAVDANDVELMGRIVDQLRDLQSRDYGVESASTGDARADYSTTRTDDYTDDAEDLPFVEAPDPGPTVPRAVPVAAIPVTPAAPITPSSVTVNVESPQVSVASPTVNVAAPQVTLNVEAPQVTLNVDAPQVSVEPPQVTVNLDPEAIARRVAARVPHPASVTADGSPVSGGISVGAELDERVISVLDRMIDRLDRIDQRAEEVVTPIVKPPRVVKPRADRPMPKSAEMTAQEKVVTGSTLRLPRPDREVTAVDRKILSDNFTVIDEDIPAVKNDYVMNTAERMVMQRMVSVRTMGVKMGRVNETRSFGIYGPPGTGKNELARQFAASLVTVDEDGNERQGVHFEQVEFDRDMDTGALIGTTALENGSTVARLGPIGLAAVQGSVICLNEVVRNPKALTQFQSMIEEGEIRLKTPEAGIIKIPIHPATTFVQTWNPGLEGDADRPAEAPRSRTISMELPAPNSTEQAMRVNSFFSKAPKEILPTASEVNASIAFFTQIRSAINQGKIQQRGRGSKAVPGPRDLNFFVLAGKTDGWPGALEQMRIFCDQNVEDRDKDWKLTQETFAINFGHSVPTRIR